MPEEEEQEKGKGQRWKVRFEGEIVPVYVHVFLLKSNTGGH